MLSEKFFFGEEDFEFSLRLKRKGKKAAVFLSSKVYHKIAQSAENQWENNSEKILNAALNRIINIRDYFSPLKWYIWRFFTIIYYYYLMISLYKIPPIFSLKICGQIFKYSSILKSVDRNEAKLIINKIL